MTKKRLFTMLVAASLLSVTGKAAFADTAGSVTADTNAASTDQLIQKMSQQTNALEAQMKQLKKQIHQLKVQEQHLQSEQATRINASAKTVATKSEIVTAVTAPAPANPNGQGQPTVKYLNGIPVMIAPYIGNHTAFNASDLIVNYSWYNEDLRLLQLRQNICEQCMAQANTTDFSPLLMLSGKIEGQAIYQKSYTGYNTNHISLATAELDIIPILSEWANGFIAMTYDNSQVPNTALVNNSRIFVDRGFLTIGNLNQFPMYATIGQLYVPFGSYTSNMISTPLTAAIFQTKARALVLGYESKNGEGPYGQLYAFNGDTATNHNNNINNLGANVGYQFSNDTFSTEVGIGAIANIADSLGMQQTGAAIGFAGFAVANSVNATPEFLHRQVPGVDVRANLGVGNVGFTAEYLTAASQFAYQDMTFDGAPAQPKALNTELSYSFRAFDKPSAITIGYQNSWQALALNVPEHRYTAVFSTSIWRDTVQQLELRHDENYSLGTAASAVGVAVPASAIGGSSNTVIGQLGIYF